MEKVKKFFMGFIAVIGVGLIGYHWTDNYTAFVNPTFANVSFTLAIVFWTAMLMIAIKMWVQKNIRDKWKEKNKSILKATCIVLIAFCIGCTIANLNILLVTTVTVKKILPIICIPVFATVWYALRPEKEKSGFIGGDIDH